MGRGLRLAPSSGCSKDAANGVTGEPVLVNDETEGKRNMLRISGGGACCPLISGCNCGNASTAACKSSTPKWP